MDELHRLLEDVDLCITCPDLAPCRKLPVKSHGRADSRMMIVNQYPDQKSFNKDRYWSNAAGEKLRGIFSDIQLVPEEVCYITDVVKCLPPRGRKPKKTEFATCLNYLRRELEIIEPEFIVSVGDVATKAVFALHGLDYINLLKLHNENGINEIKTRGHSIIPVQHPSQASRFMDFVLYRYHLKDVFIKSVE